MASYQVDLTKSAEKDLRKIDRRYIPKIFAAIESLQREPRPVTCKKLVGADHTYRIRVGNYRVVYEIEENRLIVLVVKIGHRRDIYN